jgi:hypothetical protein
MKLAMGASVAVLLAVAACGQQASTTGSLGVRPAATRPPAATSPPSGPLTWQPTVTATPPPPKQPHPKQDEHLTQQVVLPKCPHTTASPHFATPEAMMRYLAAAWNRNDIDAMCHVTNPYARELLARMHGEAVNLRLNHCERQPGEGWYVCYLDHDYPASMHKRPGRVGHAVFDAGPADRPGWYMTIFESCG